MKEKFFTIKDAAEWLGVSPTTLRRWEEKGELIPERTVGNQRRYSLSNLLAFKNRGTNPNRYTYQPQNNTVLQSEPQKIEHLEPITNPAPILQPTPLAPLTSVSQTHEAYNPNTNAEERTKILEKHLSQKHSFSFQNRKPLMLGMAAVILVLFISASSLSLLSNSASKPTSQETQVSSNPSVLAAKSKGRNLFGEITFNISTLFTGKVAIDNEFTVTGESLFTEDVTVDNKNLTLGTGRLTASNVVYGLTAGANVSITGDPQNPTISATIPVTEGVDSFQGQTGNIELTTGSGIGLNGLEITNIGVLSLGGQTGDVSLAGGNGIEVSGTTIENTDPGSAQNIFKTIIVDAASIVADSNDDTLSFVAGSGIVLTPDTSTKTITITSNASGTLAGLTTNGVLYASSSTNASSTPAGTSGTVLKGVTGGAPVFGAVSLSSDITGLLPVANGGTGIGTTASNGQLLIGNGSGYTLGTITAGTGIGVSNGSGTISVTNNGVLSLTGTANQVNVSGATGAITLSLPQNINTGATPTFASLNLTANTNQLTLGTGNTGVITLATLTSGRTYTLPDADGEICLSTGNCPGGGGGTINGSGSTNYLPKFTNATTIGNSAIYDSGGRIGIGTISPQGLFSVSGNAGGAALVSLNETGGQSILTGSASGVTRFVFDNSGNLNLIGGSYQISGATVLSSNTLGAGVTASSLTSVSALDAGSITANFGSINIGTDAISGGNITSTGTTGFTATGNDADLTFSGTGNHTISASSGTLQIGAASLTGNLNANSQNITGLTDLSANGTVTFGAFTSNGGILYTNASGQIIQVPAGSATQILHGGTTPSFGAVNLTTDITGTLPIGNGGTGSTGIGSAGSIAYSNGSNYVFTGVGGAGQILSSNGSGAPTWIDSSNLGTNYWQRSLGALSPLNITDDLLLGATSTGSARFAFTGVAGGTPTASVSAGTTNNATYLSGAGNLGTTNRQTLTLGGTSTGNIVLANNSIFTGSLTLNNDLIADFTGDGLAVVGNALSVDVLSSSDSAGLATSRSGLELRPGSGGKNQLTLLQGCANGQILKWDEVNGVWACGADMTGVSAAVSNIQEGAGPLISGIDTIRYDSTQFDISQQGATGIVALDASLGLFKLANGAYYTGQQTADFLVGGNATSSAKFAVINVNSGTPTASISAGTGNNATYLSGNGTLGTTNRQSLTIGSASTGNIILNGFGSGLIRSNAGGVLSSSSVDLSSGDVTNTLPVNRGGTGAVSFTSNGLLYGNGTGAVQAMAVGTDGQLLLGQTGGAPAFQTLSGDATINASGVVTVAADAIALGTDTTGNYVATITSGNGISATATGEGSTPTIALAALTSNYDQTGAFDIVLNNASSELQILESTGGTYFGTIDVGDLTDNKTYIFPDFVGTSATVCLTTGNCAGGGGGITGTGTAGQIAFFNGAGTITSESSGFAWDATTNKLGIGNDTPAGKLDVNGAATGTALVVLNETGGQSILTGSASGTTRFTFDNAGNLNLTAGSFQIGGTSVLNGTTLGSTVLNSSLQSVGTITSGTWQATAIAPQYGGTGDNTSATTGVAFVNAGDWQYEAQLSSARGGTGADLSGSNQGAIPYFASTGVMTSLAPGTAGYVLRTNGAGQNPTWVDPATFSSNYFQRVNGALAPANITDDFLLGSNATASARFAFINNAGAGVPTASISAGSNNTAFLTGAGNLGTTNGQTLTVGGNTTGNILLDSGSGLITLADATILSSSLTVGGTTTLNGTATLNSTATLNGTTNVNGIFALGDGGDTGSINTSDWDISATGDMTGIGAIAADGNFSQTGATTFSTGTGAVSLNGDTTIQSDNSLTIAGLTTDGGILYTNGSGLVAQTAAGTPGYVLQSNGTGAPTWVNPDSLGTNFWNQTNGAIAAKNTTVDLLVGGTSTASAKFGLINVNSGVPTASIAGTTNNAMYITGNGTIGTTNGQTLTIASSGNVVLNGFGAGVVKSNTSGVLSSSAINLNSADVTNVLQVANGGTGTNTFTSNGIVYGNGTGSLQVTAAGTNGQLLLGVSSGAPVFATLSSDATITNAGVLTIAADAVALGTDTTGNYVSSVTSGSGINVTGLAGEGWTPTVALSALTANWNQTGAFDIVLNNASSELRILESTGGSFFGAIDIGDLSGNRSYTFPDQDGNVCLSSGNCAGGAGGSKWQLNGNVIAPLTTTNQLALGGSLVTDFLFEASGAQTGKALISLNETGDQNILTASASGVTVLNVTRSGTLQMLESAGGTYFGTLSVGDLSGDRSYVLPAFVGSSADICLSTGNCAGSGGGLTGSGNTNQIAFFSDADSLTSETSGFAWDTNTDRLGIGTDSPTGKLTVTGNNNDQALVIFNETGGRDIFTASASGTTRLTLSNAGNLNLSGGVYQANGVSGITQASASCVTTTNGIVTGIGPCQAGYEPWITSNGAIYTDNPTLDLLLGGSSTASAKFAVTNISGGTPTASISANLGNNAAFLTGAGNLGTVNRQTLTLGGTTTGNILIDSGSGLITLADATVLSSALTVGGTTTLNGIFALGDGGDTGSINTSDWDISATGDLTGIGAITADGNFSQTGATTFSTGTGAVSLNGDTSIQSDNTFTIAGLTTNGGLLYTNGSGTVAQTAAGTPGYVLQSNGTGAPTWINPSTLGTNYWQRSLGAISPINISDDLLLGSTATDSARFAFTGVAGGTPTASLSAGLAGALLIDATGRIQTTTFQNLTLGGSTTGAIVLDSGNAGVSILDAVVLSGNFTQGGASTFTTGTGNVSINGNTTFGSGTTITQSGTGQVSFGGNVDATNGLDVTGSSLTVGGSNATITPAGAITGTQLNIDNLQLDGNTLSATSGDLTIGAAGNNIAFTDGNSLIIGGHAGNVAYNVLSDAGGTPVSGQINSDDDLYVEGALEAGALYQGGNQVCDISGNCSSLAINYWDQANGTISPKNPTVDLLIGGNSTASAKFAILNVNPGSGTPTASVSGTTGSAYLTAAGVLGTSNNQTLRIGTAGTGNVVIDSGNGVIALSDTATIAGSLILTGVISDADSNLVLDDTVDIGSAANGIRIDTNGQISDSNGNVAIADQVDITGALTLTGTISNGSGNLVLDDTLDLGSVANGLNITTNGVLSDNDGNLSFNDNTDVTGVLTVSSRATIGSATPGVGKLNVTGAEVGKALVILNETGNQNILTASASGTTVANLDRSGNLSLAAGATVDTLAAGALNIGTGVQNALTLGRVGATTTINGDSLTVGPTAWTATPTISGLITATSGLTANGALIANNTFTLGDNGDTGSINTSDWDISTAGDMTGIGALTMDGNFSQTGATTFSTGTSAVSLNGDTTIQSDNTFTIAGLTTNGGILYTNGSGTVAQTAAGVSGQILKSNGTGAPTWVDIAGISPAYWQRNLGAVAPSNITDDLLLGSTATASARFAFTGVAGGTPTASLSAGLAGALSLNATGTIQTTAFQTFTLGGNTTGNVVIDSGNGSIQLADNTTLAGALTITGVISDSDSNLVLDDTVDIGSAANGIRIDTNGQISDINGNVAIADQVDITGALTLTGTISNGSGNVVIDDTVDLGSVANGLNVTTNGVLSDNDGNLSLNDNTDVTGNFTTSGRTTLGSATPGVSKLNVVGFETGKALTIFNETGGNDIFSASASGTTRFTLANNGIITASAYTTNGGLLYSNASGVIGQTGAGTAQQCLFGGTTPTWGACASGQNNWQLNNGALSTIPAGADVLFGGSATNSARFAFINNLGAGTPTASVSANTGNNATYLTGAGNLGTVNAQTLLLGGTTTGNVVIDAGSGLVTIADNTTFSQNITIAGTTGVTFSSTGGINLAGGTISDSNDEVDINDDLEIAGNTTFGDATTDTLLFNARVAQDSDLIPVTATGTNDLGTSLLPWDNLYVGAITQNGATLDATYAPINANFITVTSNGTLTGETGIDSLTTLISTTNNLNVDGTTTLGATTIDPNQNLILSAGTGRFGIGTNTPLAAIDVRGNSATTPVASFSGTTTNAGLIVDNNGTGDIFSASKSGATKFTVLNNGNVQINNLANCPAIITNASGVLSCGSAASQNYWQLNAGALSPFVSTADLLLGSNATASARFAFINNAGSGTPTASVSANLGNNATFLTGAGNLGTANAQTLTLGGTSTGNVVIDAGSGLISLADNASFAQNLTVAGTTGLTFSSTGGINLAGGTLSDSTDGVDINDDLEISGNTTFGDATSDTLTFTAGVAQDSDLIPVTTTGTNDLGSASFPWDNLFVGSITQNGSTLNASYAPINANFITVTSNGTLTGETGIDNLTTAISTTNNLNVDGTTTLGATTIDANQNLVLAAGTGRLGIGTASPLAAIDVRGNSATTPVSSISGNTNFATEIIDQSGTGDIFTASKSGATKFTILNNGNITAANYTVDQGILFTAGNTPGLFKQTAAPVGAGLCLQSAAANGTPTWGACDSAASVNSFNIANGLLYNGNLSTDFAIGGLSSVSAKFLVSMSGTRSTASVSGSTANAALIVDNTGLGDIFTASKSGATKFAVLNNGNLAFAGTNSVLSTLASAATSAQTWTLPNASGTLCISGSATCGFALGTNYWQSVNAGTIAPFNDTYDLLVGGVSSSSAKFKVSPGGTQVTASVSGLTSNAALVVDNRGNGDLFTASSAGLSRFTIKQNGTVGIGTTLPTAMLDVAGTASISSQLSFQTGAGAIQTTAANTLTLGGSTTGNIILSPKNNLGRIGVNTTNPLATLDVRGSSGTTPVASVSGNTASAAFIVDNNGTGDLFTASKSGATKFVIDNAGNVGIGTTTPTSKLSVVGNITNPGTDISLSQAVLNATLTANNTSFLTINQNEFTGDTGAFDYGEIYGQNTSISLNGSGIGSGVIVGRNNIAFSGAGTLNFATGSDNSIFHVGAGTLSEAVGFQSTVALAVDGDISNAYGFRSNISNTGAAGGDISNAYNFYASAASNGSLGLVTNAYGVYIGNQGTTETTNATGLYIAAQNSATTTNYAAIFESGRIGMGTTSPLSSLDLRASGLNSGTVPVASISGQTSNATLVTDNSGLGDIFTASKSGRTKFTVMNNGNLQFAGTSNFLNTIQTAATAARTYTLPDATGTLCIQGSASCGFSVGTNNWNIASGLLYNGNLTTDFAIGGTTSSSAKFLISPSGTRPTASVSGSTSVAALVVDNTGTGDLFSASKSGASKFVINNNGNIQFAGTSNFLNTIQTAATAARTYTLPDASGTVCLQGSGSCGFATGTNFWQSANAGTIAPYNTTVDLLIGGTATNSAKFAILGVAAGTPIATLSATTNNNGLSLNAATATLQSVRNNTLTLGGDTTGNITLSPLNGTGSVTANAATLNLNGTTAINGGATAINFNEFDVDAATGSITINDAGDGGSVNVENTVLDISTLAFAGAGTLTGSTLTLDATSYVRVGDTATPGSANGDDDLFIEGDVEVDGTLFADGNIDTTFIQGSIVFAGTNGVLGQDNNNFFWDTNNARLGLGTISPLARLDIRGQNATTPAASISANSNFAAQVIDQSGIGDIFTASKSGATKFTILNSGNLSLANYNNCGMLTTTGTVLTCSAAPGVTTNYWNQLNGLTYLGNLTTDFAIGGTTSNSAKFLVSQSGTRPTASVSATTSFAGLVVDQTGSGDIFAASKGGASKFVINNAGNVGIGTATPATALEISNGILRLSGTGGQFDLRATGASLDFGGTNDLNILNNTPYNTYFGGTGSLALGITANALARLDVRANSAITPIASIAGSTNFAGLVVDNNGTGDLFTASKSGRTKFAILNNGNIGFAGTNNVMSTLASAATGAQTWTLPNESGTLCIQGSGNCGFSVGTNNWTIQNGLLYNGNLSTDFAIGGLSSASAEFLVSLSGTRSTASVSGRTSMPALYVDNTGSGDLFAASKSGASVFTVTNRGDLQLELNNTYLKGTRADGVTAYIAGVYTDSFTQIRSSGVNQGIRFADVATNTLVNILNNGTIGIGAGTLTPRATLDLRAVSNTLPVASISGSTTNASLLVDNNGNGDLFAASKSGATKFVIKNNGFIGVGTDTPSNLLTVKPTIDGQDALVITESDSNTLAVAFRSYNNGGQFVMYDSGNQTLLLNGAASSYFSNGLSVGLFGGETTLAGLDIRGTQNNNGLNGIQPIASFSGTTSKAAVVIDQSGSGDLFTASKSGATKFTILNNGNLSLGNYNNCGMLTTTGTVLTCSSAPGASTNYWNQLNGLTYLGNLTSDFAIGGTASNSAKFLISQSGTNPTASVSGLTSNAALVVDNRGTGDLFTASSGGLTRFTIAQNGSAISRSTALNAFQVQTATGTTVTNVDTINARLEITGNSFDSNVANSQALSINGSYISLGDPLGAQTFANGIGIKFNDAGVSHGTLKFTSSVTTPRFDFCNSSNGSALTCDPGTETLSILTGTAGQVGIGTTSPLAGLDVRGRSGTTPVASFSGSTTNVGLIVDNNGTGDLFTASKSGATKFTILNSGNISLANYNNCGMLTTTGTVLTCSSAPAGSTNYWNQVSGLTYLGNLTSDFAIGGTASNSSTTNFAKFAVLGINSGTPTASLSAGTAGGAYLNATGTLATTAKQTLTIGDTNTGNIVILGSNGPGGIANAGSGKAISLTTGNGGNGSTLGGNGGLLSLTAGNGGNGAGASGNAGSGGSLTIAAGNGGTAAASSLGGVGGSINITAGLGKNGTLGIDSNGGDISLTGGSIDGTHGDSRGGNLYLAGGAVLPGAVGTTGNILLGITSGGAVQGNVGIGTLTVAAKLDVRGSSATLPIASFSGQTTNAGLIVDNTGTGDLFTASKSGATKFTILNSGNLSLANYNNCGMLTTTGTVLTCSSAPAGSTNYFNQLSGLTYLGNLTSDFAIGGLASNSAKFLISQSGTRPTASVSANTSNAGLIVDNAGVGDLFTASKSGKTQFAITNGGTVAIGAFPRASVGDTPTGSLHLWGNTAGIGSSIQFGDVSDLSNAYIKEAGNTDSDQLELGGRAGLILATGGSGASTYGVERMRIDTNGNVGINTTNPLVTLDVRGNSATTPTASFSAVSNFAGLVVDNNGTGDLFTASKGGATKFVIKGNGTVGIGTFPGTSGQTPTGTLHLWGPGTGGSMATLFFGDQVTAGNPYIKEGGNGDTDRLEIGGRTSIAFATGTSIERMRLDQSGNLFIGNGVGVASALANLDVRGITTHQPSASISATSTAASFVVDQAGTGDIFVASKSGATKFVIANSGRVVIGREMNSGNTNELLSLKNVTGLSTDLTLEDGNSTNRWTVFANTTGSTGFYDATNARSPFTIEANTPNNTLYLDSGGFVGVGLNNPSQALELGASGIFQMNSGQIQDYGDIGFKIDADNNSSNVFKFINGAGTTVMNLNESGQLGLNIGNATPLSTLDIRASSATTAVASVSGSTNLAALVVNNSGNGDIIAASKSGLAKFTVNNSGNVVLSGDMISYASNSAAITNNGSTTFINSLSDQGSMIPNAGFEASTSAGLGFADGWTRHASSSGSLRVDTAQASQGTNSIRATLGTTGAAGMYSACVPLSPSVTAYTVSFHAKPNATGNTPTVRGYINAYSSKVNCASNISPTTMIGTPAITWNGTNWVAYSSGSITASTTQGLTWGRVQIGIVSGNQANTIFIDGVRLTQNAVTTGLDYAENYPADPNDVPTAGDLVSLVTSGSATFVSPSKQYKDQKVIGIMSTQPGQTLDDGTIPEPKVPVALAGRVPVKVSTKNGTIAVGDYLTSSDIPGVAVKATTAGPAVGKAMESYLESDTTKIGQIITFVNNTWYSPVLSLGSDDEGLSFDYRVASSAAVNTLKSDVASNSGQLTQLASQFASLSDRLSFLETNASSSSMFGGFSASSAAQLGLDKLEVNDATVSGTLSVLGRTTLSDVGITGTVNIGLLSINGLDDDGQASINTVAGPLKLQSTGINGIDMLNGKVTVSTSGNIVTEGTITTKKVNIDTADVAGASLGTTTIAAGATQITVTTTALTTSSKIFATVDGDPIAIGTKKTGATTFTIKIPAAQATATKVNWWIVN